MFDRAAAAVALPQSGPSFGEVTEPEVRSRAEALATAYLEQGVTFDIGGEERAFPLDIMPSVIEQEAWHARSTWACSSGCAPWSCSSTTCTTRAGSSTTR